MRTFIESKVKLLLQQKEFALLKNLFNTKKGAYSEITTLYLDTENLSLHDNKHMLKVHSIKLNNTPSFYVELEVFKERKGVVVNYTKYRYKPSPKEILLISGCGGSNIVYDIFKEPLKRLIKGDLKRIGISNIYRFKVTGVHNEYLFDVISCADNKTYTADILGADEGTANNLDFLCKKHDIKYTLFPKNEYELLVSDLQIPRRSSHAGN